MVKSYFKAIVLIIVLVFVATFSIKNSGSVNISYYFGILDLSAPLYLIVLACLVIGAVIGFLFCLAGRFTLKKRLRKLEKEYKEMHTELELLRSKAAVPVYNETIYVPTPKPAQDNPREEHDVRHISDAY